MKSMNFLGLFLALLISFSFNLSAETSNYKSGSLLWKISGNGLEKPSYLLGTFHLKPGEYLDSIPGARKAFESSEQIVGELTMLDMTAMQTQMQQHMMMPSDTTYKMLYSEEQYQEVNDLLMKQMGAGLDQLTMLKPAIIQLSVVVMAYMKYFPTQDMTNPLDQYIQTQAVKEGKDVVGLETIDRQIYALVGMYSLQRQADLLLCGLKEMDKSMKDTEEFMQSYTQGDLNKLYASLDDPDSPCPNTEFEKNALNKDRNDAWMKKLPQIMKEKSSFIAVGALHLAGEVGLLNQLEKAGFSVEPVL